MPLTFIVITDTHIAETPDTHVCFYATARAAQAVLKHIAENDGHGASFIAQTGDVIVSFQRPESYDCVKSIYDLSGNPTTVGPLTITAEGLNLPWYYAPGNTDERSQCLARLFPNCDAVKLFNYSWELNGTRFLSVDWGASGTDEYILDAQTYAWLEKQLQQRLPTIIFTHHPPVHVGVEYMDKFTPPDLNRLQELIAPSSVIAIFHGHTHYPSENKIGDIPVFGTGSVAWRLCLHNLPKTILEIHPPQYRVVTVNDDNSVKTEIYEVPLQ